MNGALTLTVGDFERALGVAAGALPAALQDRIRAADFRYEPLTPAERDAVILAVTKRVDSGELSRVGEHRQAVWEKGWEENLDAFAGKGFALESLVPRFFRPEPIVRLRQDYVRAGDAKFEFHFHDILRRWLFAEFMAGADAVYEFGSGSAYNLVAFAGEARRGMKFVGLDWAESAVRLTDLVGRTHGLTLTGRRFDFFHPDESLEIGPGDVALTISALEQVGARHGEFLDFLLRKRPKVCVHMEPMLDLYDPENLADYLAIRFHTARNYLSGFLGRLRQLETERKIEIMKVHRAEFGSLYHESYSLVVWRPRG
jgi:hypothetical protein